jgi:RimJ/RimL family protein N-acetyltransferase
VQLTFNEKEVADMKRIFLACSTVFCAVLLFSQSAFSWGWAVHTYIEEQFENKWQIRDANLLYGVLVPDIFNYEFNEPALYMKDQTHHNFMKLWNASQSQPGRALAFGFVSHNELWGMDYTSHISGITFGQLGTIPGHPDEGGYIIAKAYILKGYLDPVFSALQLPDSVALTVCHELVEYGVDLLMRKYDPMIGEKITAAALPPNPNFPMLMEKAYADDLAAQFGMSNVETHTFLVSSERQFRQLMVLYGQVLMQDDSTAIALIADQLAGIATEYLAANGITLPPGFDNAQLIQLVKTGIGLSMALCQNDFYPEVSATSDFVVQQLAEHGIEN